MLQPDDFRRDPHAARYVAQFDEHPRAMARLIEILNEPANEQRLEDAANRGDPALKGVVSYVEGDAAINDVLATGAAGHRFRQTVGVAVRLKMERLGWATTGRKGSMGKARHFTKAERYAPGRSPADDYETRALAALDAVAAIGDEDERAETGRVLMEALAATRAAEGRAF
jgi:hypothetical protein